MTNTQLTQRFRQIGPLAYVTRMSEARVGIRRSWTEGYAQDSTLFCFQFCFSSAFVSVDLLLRQVVPTG